MFIDIFPKHFTLMHIGTLPILASETRGSDVKRALSQGASSLFLTFLVWSDRGGFLLIGRNNKATSAVVVAISYACLLA